MRKTFIYGLKEPDGEIRYVGKADDVKRRLRQHKSNARLEKSHKVNWIKSCLNRNVEIVLVILEEVEYSLWEEREVYWISQFNDLTNHDKGGCGGKPEKFKLTYDECKNWVYENLPNITSQNLWYKNKKTLPDFISPYPADTYKYRGWISWGDFLNTGKVADKYKIFLNYKKAKKFLSENYPEIKNTTTYRKTKLPDFIHKKPEKYHKKDWCGWNDYLSTTTCKRFDFIDYDNFKIWINKNYPNNKTNKLYKNLIKENKIPPFIPKNPKTAYKDKGWSGWLLL